MKYVFMFEFVGKYEDENGNITLQVHPANQLELLQQTVEENLEWVKYSWKEKDGKITLTLPGAGLIFSGDFDKSLGKFDYHGKQHFKVLKYFLLEKFNSSTFRHPPQRITFSGRSSTVKTVMISDTHLKFLSFKLVNSHKRSSLKIAIDHDSKYTKHSK